MKPFVSILMLVHNAPRYTRISIRSLRRATVGVDYELVVVDNASDEPTRELVRRLKTDGLIDKLRLMDYNSMFAEGNNVAAAMADQRATHFLLLNSDVKIQSKDWLSRLVAVHERGATSYGIAVNPLRVDGYCMLIDADLYRANQLDESYQWWFGVTKQQAALLREGYAVRGYGEHRGYLHHYGGKSGNAFTKASGLGISREDIYGWFEGHEAVVLDRRPDGSIPGWDPPSLPTKVWRRVRRMPRGALRRARHRLRPAAR